MSAASFHLLLKVLSSEKQALLKHFSPNRASSASLLLLYYCFTFNPYSKCCHPKNKPLLKRCCPNRGSLRKCIRYLVPKVRYFGPSFYTKCPHPKNSTLLKHCLLPQQLSQHAQVHLWLPLYDTHTHTHTHTQHTHTHCSFNNRASMLRCASLLLLYYCCTTALLSLTTQNVLIRKTRLYKTLLASLQQSQHAYVHLGYFST
jgi:hypothetical protein